ncbi:MAG: hypothetical protein KJO82_15965 [Gammaproteobacteria bacterium]|nr:hypothetical protein [Gammaproteobacteria bacterium]
MQSIRVSTMLLLVLAVAAWAQDQAADPPETDDTETVVEADADDEVVGEEENYRDADDDDFRPSEDIPADQSIAFPADI